MLYHIYVCVTCREEFEPIEGADASKDFCSWDCEDEYAETQEQEEFAAIYNEAFGRRAL
jgi:hypothetical protein